MLCSSSGDGWAGSSCGIVCRIADGSRGDADGLGRESLSIEVLAIYAPVADPRVASDIVMCRDVETKRLCCPTEW